MLKNSLLLTTSAVVLLPTLVMGLVGIEWNVTIDGVIASDLTDITFPFSIADASHITGYYFAQQFNFNGQSDVGYTGLQSRPDDSGGHPVIHAAFSSFIDGTTTNDGDYCHPGADGGPGVSCAVDFSAPYADAYEIEVINTQGTMWTGTVVDTTTGKRVHIGSWTLPAGTGGIKGSQGGFIEEYLNGSDCPNMPYTSMVFGLPKTTKIGAVGNLGDAYEYGDCTGKVAFKSHRTLQGVAVSVGFK